MLISMITNWVNSYLSYLNNYYKVFQFSTQLRQNLERILQSPESMKNCGLGWGSKPSPTSYKPAALPAELSSLHEWTPNSPASGTSQSIHPSRVVQLWHETEMTIPVTKQTSIFTYYGWDDSQAIATCADGRSDRKQNSNRCRL